MPTPNEPEKLEFHNGLVEFLEGLAAGLGELAETLDKMVANQGNDSEPILLGKAAIIANHLGIGAMDYIANNREKLEGVLIRGSLMGAATALARALGIDKALLEIIANIIGKK
jgi:signal transduction protein with GAF and PtsI domain